jgi:CheY-like chemotaxis protein
VGQGDNGHGRTILIVDDEADIVDVVGHVLSDEGYRVLTAYNGKEGLERMATGSKPPDIVLLDLMMPVMDGREMLLAMRDDARFQSVQVLVMSAGDCTPIAEEFKLPMIKKPFGLKPLLAKLDELVG